jgi:hypothetical protein
MTFAVEYRAIVMQVAQMSFDQNAMPRLAPSSQCELRMS